MCWFYVVALSAGFMYWFCALVSCVGFTCSSHVLVFWPGVMCWFYELCVGFMSWCFCAGVMCRFHALVLCVGVMC